MIIIALNKPFNIALSVDGTFALVADNSNNKIRQLLLATKVVTTLAGGSSGFADATGSPARF
jgi:hypothetical protein